MYMAAAALDLDVDLVLKALAVPVRRRIVDALATEELCVCHLVDLTGASQSLVSHHLQVLRDAGVVEAERYRQWTYYRLRPPAVRSFASYAAGLSGRGSTGRRRRPCP